MKTFLFYDLETSGLNPAFDQVMQFAAIRTDESLNELERHKFHCQLRPDIIPHLSAVLTHRLSPLQAQDDSLYTERECVRYIHALLNQPGTVSVGYNTLGFDDEFLRFSFFRNLLPPYTHQFKDKCQRMDLLPIVVMYYLFYPQALSWPSHQGKTSLKLEDLNQQNKWVEGQAHDAMIDVEATVALAHQLMQYQSMWNYCTSYFDKQLDQACFAKWALKDNPALWIHHRLGVDQKYIAPVAYLGQHWHFKNQLLFVRLDQQRFDDIKPEDWPDNIWVYKKKWGVPGLLLPYQKSYAQHLSEERQQIAQYNWQWIHNNPHLWQQLQKRHLDYKPETPPEADPDSVLYQHGLISRHDEQISSQFHQHRQDLDLQQQLINELSTAELRELAWRMLIRNHHNHLPDKQQSNAWDFFQKQITQPVVDYRRQAKYNLNQARQDWLEQKANEANLDTQQQELLNDYEHFLNNKQRL